jgi:hypothetical protein
MIIFYRYSDGGYAKQKLEIATKEVCLTNFLLTFNTFKDKMYIVADNVKDDTFDFLSYWSKHYNPKLLGTYNLERTQCGSSAASFKYVFEKVLLLNLHDEQIIYFIEDDYLHTIEAPKLIQEGLEHFHFVTLYDHPDKYGGNPLVADGGEVTRVVKGATRHWKYTNSTTMTFATTAGTLRQSKDIILKHTQGTYPTDFQMFLDLREAGFALGSPLPGASTHIETAWLSPFEDWEYIAKETIAKEQVRNKNND